MKAVSVALQVLGWLFLIVTVAACVLSFYLHCYLQYLIWKHWNRHGQGDSRWLRIFPFTLPYFARWLPPIQVQISLPLLQEIQLRTSVLFVLSILLVVLAQWFVSLAYSW